MQNEIIDTIFMKLQKDLIAKGPLCKQPTQEEMVVLFAPVKECSDKLNVLNRDRDFPANYVKAMSEVVGCINWVNIVRITAKVEM